MPVEAVYRLPAPVYCRSDVLGSTFPTIIGTLRVDVLLPAYHGSYDEVQPFQNKLSPPPSAHSHLREWAGKDVWWGAVEQFPDGLTWVGAIALRVDTSAGQVQPRQAAATLHGAIATWMHLVYEWLAVSSGQVFDQQDSRPFGGPLTPGLEVYDFSVDAPRNITPLMFQTILGPAHAASHESHWREALHKAAMEESLPAEHTFLQSARRMMRRGEHRIAVIEACTAAEVAVARSIRDMLSSALPNSSISAILGQASGLANLMSLLKGIGGPLPASRSRAMDQLLNPRNEAAHSGKVPTPSRASNALATAGELVNGLTPLRDRSEP